MMIGISKFSIRRTSRKSGGTSKNVRRETRWSASWFPSRIDVSVLWPGSKRCSTSGKSSSRSCIRLRNGSRAPRPSGLSPLSVNAWSRSSHSISSWTTKNVRRKFSSTYFRLLISASTANTCAHTTNISNFRSEMPLGQWE